MTARILIVENEPVLAKGLQRFFLSHGYEIAGCMGSVKAAFAAIVDVDCDIALLDVNLRGESVLPVAEASVCGAVRLSLCRAMAVRSFLQLLPIFPFHETV